MAPPELINIPWSASTVTVSIIDTHLKLGNSPTSFLFGPTIEGFETTTGGVWSFLIDHQDERLVFDLGTSQDWENDYPPHIVSVIQSMTSGPGATIEVPKSFTEVLEDGGVSPESVDAVIWSHTHWDHIGRPSLFPPSTDLIVGEGTLDFFGPGYPESSTSPYLSRELANRTVTELKFPASAARIGGLAALDYFGDGSFYILEAPGHETGHINALARVTARPPTFIFMGADSFHNAAQLRPSRQVPLPKRIRLEEPLTSAPNPVPGKLLQKIHPSRNISSLPAYAANLTSATTSPFVTINIRADGTSLARNPPIARDVISKIQRFDGDDRIFVVAAHDETVRGVVDLFPKKANNWKAKGWKTRTRWRFVNYLDAALGLATQEDE
ncbi:hypothetical protein ACHAQA_009012 [Verticillium albo-atrum]